MGIIYKFRDWENEYHRSIITEQKIYFASPDKLNDPWDCKIYPRYDKIPKSKKEDFFRSLIRRLNPQMSSGEISKNYNSKIKNLNWDEYRPLYNNIVNRYGIFSATKRKDHILLWSHYANNHQGFCVGFDEHILSKDIFDAYNKVGYTVAVKEIQYVEKMPIYIPNINSVEGSIRFALFTKYELWRYENEIRFLLWEGADTLFTFKKEDVKEVIFGINIHSDVKNEIINIVKYSIPNAKLYQAQKKFDNYEITFDELSLDAI